MTAYDLGDEPCVASAATQLARSPSLSGSAAPETLRQSPTITTGSSAKGRRLRVPQDRTHQCVRPNLLDLPTRAKAHCPLLDPAAKPRIGVPSHCSNRGWPSQDLSTIVFLAFANVDFEHAWGFLCFRRRRSSGLLKRLAGCPAAHDVMEWAWNGPVAGPPPLLSRVLSTTD